MLNQPPVPTLTDLGKNTIHIPAGQNFKIVVSREVSDIINLKFLGNGIAERSFKNKGCIILDGVPFVGHKVQVDIACFSKRSITVENKGEHTKIKVKHPQVKHKNQTLRHHDLVQLSMDPLTVSWKYVHPETKEDHKVTIFITPLPDEIAAIIRFEISS